MHQQSNSGILRRQSFSSLLSNTSREVGLLKAYFSSKIFNNKKDQLKSTKSHLLAKNIAKLDSVLEKASNKLLKTTSSNRKFLRQLNKVQTIQAVQLNKMYKLRSLLNINNDLSNKSYLDTLPIHQKSFFMDTYASDIYTAAKSLAQAAYSQMNPNSIMQQLQESAIEVCNSMAQFKNKLNAYYDGNTVHLVETLDKFDKSFIKFEQLVCSYAFVENGDIYNLTIDDETSCVDLEAFEWLVDVISNSISHLLDEDEIDSDMVESFSPELIVIVPRIAILEILAKYHSKADDCGMIPNKNINDPKLPVEKIKYKVDRNLTQWIEDNMEQFNQLKNNNLLKNGEFDSNLVIEVKNMILNNKGEEKSKNVYEAYKIVCQIADRLQSGNCASKFALVLEKAFAYNQNI